MAVTQSYVPGVCNIGPAERRLRMQVGIAGLVGTVAMFMALELLDAPLWWRLLLVLPASGAAMGFLQNALHFCVGFGLRGMYNVVHGAGVVDTIEREEFRQKDKKKALTILFLSVAIGSIVALASLLVPAYFLAIQ